MDPKYGWLRPRHAWRCDLLYLGRHEQLSLPALAGFVAEALVFIGAWESAHSWWALVGLVGAWITAICSKGL